MGQEILIQKGLPMWAKGVLVVAGVALTGFIVYEVYKKLNPSAKDKADADLKKKNEDELTKNAQTMSPSFPQSSYPAMANEIYEGMRYAVGDDYAGVRDTLMKMKNDLDVNLITKAYGVRQLYAFGIPSGEPKDLFTAVRSELGSEWWGLSSSKMDAVNKDWSKKGIKYTI